MRNTARNAAVSDWSGSYFTNRILLFRAWCILYRYFPDPLDRQCRWIIRAQAWVLFVTSLTRSVSFLRNTIYAFLLCVASIVYLCWRGSAQGFPLGGSWHHRQVVTDEGFLVFPSSASLCSAPSPQGEGIFASILTLSKIYPNSAFFILHSL